MKDHPRIVLPVFEPAENYLNTLRELGAAPETVTAVPSPEEYDGLLLPGGEDVDPSLYGAENRGSVGISPALDALQTASLEAFVRAGKPVFGICRGEQLINVFFGGTLVQDLPEKARHAHGEGEPDRVHALRAEEGSFLHGLYGAAFQVNSSHHQAVERLGKGLRAVAFCGEDGVVEAVAHETLPVLAVQFHPERMRPPFADPRVVSGDPVLRLFLSLC